MRIKKFNFNKRLILYGIFSLSIIGICVFVGIKINNKPSEKASITDSKVKKNVEKVSDVKIEKLSKKQQEGMFKLCKVWGFLKYYHPEVATGKLDWDQELFKLMPQVLNANEDKDIDKLLLEWTNSLGEFEQETYLEDKNVKIQPNTKWIKDNTFISGELSVALSKVETAKRSGVNHNVDANRSPLKFTNEKTYDNFDYENDDGVKLVGLFRYWNIIEYYYPYKNTLDYNWDEVLREFIPKVVESKDETKYKITLCELTTKIQDGHNGIYDENCVIDKFFGVKLAPIDIKFVEGKFVIVKKLEGLNKDLNIKVGDVILKINNKDINDLIKENLKYFGRVNKELYSQSLLWSLKQTNDKTLGVELERDGHIIKENINCKSYEEIYSKKDTKPSYESLKEDIAYIYPGTLKEGEMRGIIEKLKNTKGLIVDLRCYPAVPIMGDLGSYIRKTSDTHIKFTVVNKTVPGQFFEIKNETEVRENQNYYKGKVVIIINETTKSQAESTAMMFRMAPNSVVIGSNSTGANGDIAGIPLPGKTYTIITAVGVAYPDDRQIQRIGVIPDIEVKPTIEGIRNGNDELLEKAITLINK